MTICTTVAEVREALNGVANIGFVPTMGALHRGHVELIRQSKALCSTTVISIYVNPIQFGPNDDFAQYPRPVDSDIRIANSENADILYMPTVNEMRSNSEIAINVGPLASEFEGAIRPGHFNGVAKVLLQFFNIVRPSIAFFGLKDLQQCAVVRELVSSLLLDIELHFVETFRETSGLAMSSRNEYLTPENRAKAAALYAALVHAASQIRENPHRTKTAISEATDILSSAGFAVDYLSLVDPWKMVCVESLIPGARLMAAARLQDVRLLDNIAVVSQ